MAGATVYVLPSAHAKDMKWSLGSDFRRTGGLMYYPAVRGISGRDGAYVIDGLKPDDEYALVAAAPGFTQSEQRDRVRLGRAPPDTRADLSLRPPASVVVSVLDLAGVPLAGDSSASLSGEATGVAWGAGEKDAPHVIRFDGLEAGDYVLRVENSAFRSASRPVHVDSGAAVHVEVRLDPGASLEGIVLGEDGTPVADAGVDADGHDATTDAKGTFVIRALEPTVYAVRARRLLSSGVTLRTIESLQVAAPATGVRLVLVRFGTASIRLLTPSGEPYAGEARVRWWLVGAEDQGESAAVVEAVDGRFGLTGLPEGELELELQVEGFVPIRRKFTAHLRSHTDLGTVRLDPGIRLVVRVTDPAGAPLAGARVNDGQADATGTLEVQHLSSLGATR